MPAREAQPQRSGRDFGNEQQSFTVAIDEIPELPPGNTPRSETEPITEGFTKEDADLSERMARVVNAGCQTYWPSPYPVCGEIRDKYNAMGGPGSWLNFPKSPEYQNPGATGFRSEFINGSIYWSPATGAHPITPLFMTKWAQHNWEAGWMGYPTSDEIPNGDNIGSRQQFETGNAAIYWHTSLPDPGLAVVGGAIRDKWGQVGWETPGGLLGYPTGDEIKLPDGQGRMNRFQRGVIYWHPFTGAHEITGIPLHIWSMRGAETSEWGYPVGSPELDAVVPIAISQQFQLKKLDGKALAKEAGVETFNGKIVNSLLVEWLESKGTTFSAADVPEASLRASFCSIPDSTQEQYGGVSIPSSYDYWGCVDKDASPNPGKYARHDYCSSSPDQFPSPGQNAEFSGGCSRHDMCMDEADSTNDGYNPCNSQLWDDMGTICSNVYSGFDPRRYGCRDFRDVYWVFVTGTHLDEL